MGDTIFMVLPILLAVLFFGSLALFVSSLLKSRSQQTASVSRIEAKLDRIIELLEKKG